MGWGALPPPEDKDLAMHRATGGSSEGNRAHWTHANNMKGKPQNNPTDSTSPNTAPQPNPTLRTATQSCEHSIKCTGWHTIKTTRYAKEKNMIRNRERKTSIRKYTPRNDGDDGVNIKDLPYKYVPHIQEERKTW